MTTDELNALPTPDALAAFLRCCGASRWASAMAARRPFCNAAEIHSAADSFWHQMRTTDILEAFSHHPRIGQNLDELREKFGPTAHWSAGEQSGMNTADEITLRELAEGNRRYLHKFGYIFIVCATGKTAAEMLALLRDRLPNDAETELRIAAAEQARITRIRLGKLLEVQSSA
jgi:2-oxo-4-hydroxy-4-carboxy-5-ureidoimidazoline decarboxylase